VQPLNIKDLKPVGCSADVSFEEQQAKQGILCND
jgi:hypothetical protein